MADNKEKKVKEFLEQYNTMDHEKYVLLLELRKRVSMKRPDVSERIIYGGIMFSLKEDLGGIFPYKNHVTFEFGNGYLFRDPDNSLKGGGKFRRHLKFESPADIENSNIDFFIDQMFELGA